VLWLVLAVGCSDSGGGVDASAAKHGDAGASTDPCPHGKHAGSYEITSNGDAAAIAACTEIGGDLHVSGDALTKLSLPKLKVIGGALDVKNATALTRFDFSSLAMIGKELIVDGNPVLSTFTLPALDSSGTLLVTNNPKLADFDLDAFTKVDYLGFQGDDALTTCELPKLKSVGTFVINMNAALTTIRFDSLTIIAADGFIMLRNPVLAAIDMPMLGTLVGDIIVNDNPMLPRCRLEALVAQLDAAVPLSASRNDDSATCP
jgi:hypothetical protein